MITHKHNNFKQELKSKLLQNYFYSL